MSWVLRMVWRETRTSWTRLGFFFLCVGIGVAAIVALRSVVQNVRTALTSEARHMVGGDVLVQANRPFAGPVRDRLMAEIGTSAVLGTTDVIDTQTMAAPDAAAGNGNVRLVEIRGIEAAFPFYGALELEDGLAYDHSLLRDHGTIVQPELLAALDLRVGDRLRMAGQTFTIRGTLARDRVQRSGGIAFGPRVYVDLADLRATSVLGFGSRATYQVLIRTTEQEVAPLTERLRAAFKQDTIGVRSWQTLEDRIGQNLVTAENYLSLVGFAIVVLGGIGVWSVTRVIVQQKIRSVAILKCVGATSGRLLAIYLLQVLTLAAGGCVVGVGIAVGALALIPARMLTPLGVSHLTITPSAAAQGIAVGLLVSCLFALVPLLDIRRVKPLLLLRADTAGTARRRDWQSALAAVAILGALLLVAIWQAHSFRAGIFVMLGLAAITAALWLASLLLLRVTRPLAASSNFALRHAVISLGRPGNQTRVILMAVGLGCFFILGVRALQANLLADFATQVGPSSPDLVLIDIQEDQLESIRSVIAPHLRAPARITPLMRARVVAVAGSRVQLGSVDQVRAVRPLAREFGVTFRPALEPNERVVDGAFWTAGESGAAVPNGADTEVSIEQELAEASKIGLGDLVTFDLAGVRLSARVSSVRAVTWGDSQNGGFVFVLKPAPSVLRAAHSYIGFLQVTDSGTTRGAVQRDLVRSHPNVSVIDVRDVLQSIREVIDNVTLAVTVVGAVTLISGVLILIGAVFMTKFQRVYETAIYRSLGASTRTVATMVAIEYGMLGLLAGSVGAVGALGMSWALARYLFDFEWHPPVGLLAGGLFGAVVLVGAVGVGASIDVLWRKPLETLRGE